MAKEYFDEHSIAFTDYNVGENIEKRSEMVQKSGQLGVPVIVVTDSSIAEGQPGREEVIVGFDEERLAKLLGIS